MSEFISFRNYELAKKHLSFLEEDKLATKKGGLPNQDIPKAGKFAELLKIKDGLAGRDFKGDLSMNPVKGTKQDPLPYKAAADTHRGKEVLVAGKNVEGLGNKGNNIQTPANSIPDGQAPSKKMRMTSEEFVEQTKEMDAKEFISFFVEGSDEPLPTVTDLYGNEFTPDPTQTIQYLASLMVKNPRLLTRFIREMKRQDGGMKMLMNESQDHPEFYSMLAEGMAEPEEGKKRCHRITRAMNEQYMDAVGKFVFEQRMHEEVQPKNDLAFEDGGPMGSPPANPSGMTAPKKQSQGGKFGGGGAGMGGPQAPAPGGAMGGGGAGMGGPQAPAPGGEFGGGGAGMGSPDMGGGDMGGAPPGGGGGGMPGMPPGGAGMPPGGAGGPPEGPGFDAGNGKPPGASPGMPKLKGETAHGNLIESLHGWPHMKEHMISTCINCKD